MPSSETIADPYLNSYEELAVSRASLRRSVEELPENVPEQIQKRMLIALSYVDSLLGNLEVRLTDAPPDDTERAYNQTSGTKRRYRSRKRREFEE